MTMDPLDIILLLLHGYILSLYILYCVHEKNDSTVHGLASLRWGWLFENLKQYGLAEVNKVCYTF